MDCAEFRRAMSLFATGVAVVAAPAGDEVRAMTANAVSSLSMDPLLLLFCPAKQSRFAADIDSVEGFSVNFLRDEQRPLSDYFAGGWREGPPPPFRFVPAGAAPRLEGCLASLVCSTERVADGGDHWIVIGRVTGLHVGITPHRPLLFFGGRYRELRPEPGPPAPGGERLADEPPHICYS